MCKYNKYVNKINFYDSTPSIELYTQQIIVYICKSN